MTRHSLSRYSGSRYPRIARVNAVLREVLADAIETEAGTDERLELVTVTAVECDPDLRHATVLLDSLPAPVAEALGEARPRLQAAIARQVRMKRTPQLSFGADPAIEYGARVEKILRDLKGTGTTGEGPSAAGEGPSAAGEGPSAAGEGPSAAGNEPHVSDRPGGPAQPDEVAQARSWSGPSGSSGAGGARRHPLGGPEVV